MSEITAIIPGFFDPLHLGHVQLIKITRKIFSRVLLLVGDTHFRSSSLCSLPVRLRNIKDTLRDLNLADIDVFVLTGSLADFSGNYARSVIVRGAKNLSSETCRAHMNHELNKSCFTVFVPCYDYNHISATLVRELVKAKVKLEDLLKFVPRNVAESLIDNY